jgi:YD repeat-containing protein
MTSKTLLIIGSLIALISCTKEDILPSGNEKLTKIEIFDPSGQNTSIAEYKYDNNGNLIEISTSNGTATNGKQSLLYDVSGKIISNTLTNSVSGNVYKYDFQVDLKGRIIKATGTSFLPNLIIDDHTYTYDTQGRLIIDSVFTRSGSVHSYVNFEYDNNNNIIAYQQYVNDGTAIILVSNMTLQYDTKRSPYFKIGQVLYTSLGGSGVSYFYLSKNNPVSVTLNGTIITPGGNFIYQYYSNSLLKTSTVNVPNPIKFTFYYVE